MTTALVSDMEVTPSGRFCRVFLASLPKPLLMPITQVLLQDVRPLDKVLLKGAPRPKIARVLLEARGVHHA